MPASRSPGRASGRWALEHDPPGLAWLCDRVLLRRIGDRASPNSRIFATLVADGEQEREVPGMTHPCARVHKGKRKGHGCFAPALPRYLALDVRRDTTIGKDDVGLVHARQNAIIGLGRQGRNRGWIESLYDEPDAERQLPNARFYGHHRTAS